MSRPTAPSATERAERAATWAVRLAGEPGPAREQAEFQAWLEADPRNGEALEEVFGAWHAVDHYAASEPVMALREAALASARRSVQRRETGATRRSMAWAALAASLVLTTGGAGLWAWLTPRTYETGIGERRVVVLADGSKLSLDAATVVKVRFTHASRRLWLDRGRARFEVAKNPLRPFSVTARDDVIVATGTAFSVELVQKEVRVVLYEGHVALLRRGSDVVRPTVSVAGAALPADRLLTPGREVILADTHSFQAPVGQAVVADADPVRSLSWEAGQLVFDDEPLPVAVERMNRYAAKPMAIGDAAAAKVRISGVFRAGDTNALVQGLTATFKLDAREDAAAITLYRPNPGL